MPDKPFINSVEVIVPIELPGARTVPAEMRVYASGEIRIDLEDAMLANEILHLAGRGELLYLGLHYAAATPKSEEGGQLKP